MHNILGTDPPPLAGIESTTFPYIMFDMNLLTPVDLIEVVATWYLFSPTAF